MEMLELQTAGDQGTTSRSRLYQLLAMAFAFPDEELFAAIHAGELAAAVAATGNSLPYALRRSGDAALATAGDSYLDFESEYIRLFDVGAAGPPCPLYGGVHVGDRMKVMEDATRFYNYFGLRLAGELRELPDHITTELEFLHYLTFREAQVRGQGQDPSSLLRAERDFLARHLCRWVPRLQARLAKQDTLPFFPALVQLALEFFEADRGYASAATED